MDSLNHRLKNIWPYLALTGFLFFIGWLLFKEDERIRLVLVALFAGVGAYLVFYKKKWLLYILWLAIPLSLSLDTSGGLLRLSIPSEAIMILFTGWFLFMAFYRPVIDRRILLHPIFLLLVLDVCWLIFVSFYSTMPVVSVKRIIMKVAFICFYFLFMAHWFRDLRRTIAPYMLYGIGLIPVIYFSLKKHAVYDFIPAVSFSICQPFYADHTIYGASIAFVLPILFILFLNAGVFGLQRRGKLLLGLLFFIALTGEIFSYSRASWLSLVACLLFYMLIKLRVRFWGLLVLLTIAFGIVYSQFDRIYETVQQNEAVSNKADIGEHIQSVTNLESDASNLERINRWICAYEMFKDRPYTGFGPGTYQFEYGKYQSLSQLTYISTWQGDRGNAHSEYLTYLSETGLPGLLIFLIFAFYVIYFGLEQVYTAKDPRLKLISLGVLFGLTTFFTHGLVNAFIDQDKMAALVYTGLAVLVAIDVYGPKTKNDRDNQQA